MGAIGGFWLQRVCWVGGLALGFGLLTRLMPCNPGRSWWNKLRAAGTDLIYWFVVPLFLLVAGAVMLDLGKALLFGGDDSDLLPVRHLPLWVQCLAILVLQDILLYAIHRVFHSRFAWKFHAVHHAPEVVDWMTTARFHPVNTLLAFILVDVVALLLGFSREALVALAPFVIVQSAMVHANLNWTFGPLKYVFASPVFHRWHHTPLREAGNKNFASTFSILDVLFGTFYMPPGKMPQQFGIGEADFPEGFWGQFLYPFRAKRTPPARPAPRTGGKKRRKAA
jgi:sterol desaturase/sphingolipid hydroxylase (fatty acid hydroxylase superfamily)